MALAGGAFVIWKIGGLAVLIEDSGGLRSGELRGLGAGTFAVTALLPTVAQFGLMYALRVSSKWRWALLILCALSCTLGGVFGFRGLIFVLMIQVAAIYHVFTGRVFRVPTMILIGAAAAMVVVLGYVRIVVTEQGQAAQALMSGDRRDAMAVLLDNSITRLAGSKP